MAYLRCRKTGIQVLVTKKKEKTTQRIDLISPRV